MKKNFVAGLFAVGLIVAGGTGAYVAYAKDNTVDLSQMMKSTNMQEMMNSTNMEDMMKSTDMKEMQKLMQSKDSSFDQMLPLMKKVHPNLSNDQIKALYEKMHGKDGSPSCGNVKGTSENTSENKL